MLRPFLLATALLMPLVPTAATTPAAATAPAAQNRALSAFFAEHDARQLALNPVAKTFRGIRDADYGRWTDQSEAAAEARFQADQAALAELRRRFDPGRLSGQDRLSYRLFEDQMERSARAYANRAYFPPFDQMNGAQSQLPAFLINQHRIASRAEAEAYIARLAGMGAVLDQAIARAALSEAQGIVAPRWVFPYVVADSRNIVAGAPFGSGPASPLFADFKAKVARLDLPHADKDRLVGRAADALTGSVGPAYARVLAFAQAQQARAPAGDGVWRYPQGDRFYAERLAFHTTTDLSAAQIHQLGLEQVARIHDEMRQVQQQIGFKGTLQQFFTHMRERPENYFPNTAEGRARYIAETEAVMARMQERLPAFFSAAALPDAPLVIKAVEPFREKAAGKAFYQRPAPDGSSPGTYYVNLYDMADMPHTELEALAFHEGVPGHHLDGAVISRLGNLPAFRRFGGYTAWSEGWGLYAEKLGKDMGFYTDPYRDFGRLQLELHRAIRLVVDTGLHDKRWTREQAIRYTLDNSADAPGGVVKAIERYAIYPGQATAYMIGRRKITDLRDRARRELGAAFTMAGFHDAVLLSGRVPLDMLEENVDAWIAATKGTASAAVD